MCCHRWPAWRTSGAIAGRRLTKDRVLKIIDGRHPVLDQQLGSEFVANDVSFAAADSLQLITGPNMAGKSTFIRQVALDHTARASGQLRSGQKRHDRHMRSPFHPHRRER